MNAKSRLHLLVTIVIAGCCTIFGIEVSWASAESATNVERSITLFSCDGRYIRIDAASGTILTSGLYGGLTEPQSKMNGCLVTDLLDTAGNALYALMPDNSRVDKNGEQKFFLATLDAKTLRILKRFELPNRQSEWPLLLSDSARENLLVTIDDDGSWQRVETRSDGAVPLPHSLTKPKVSFPTSPSPYIDGHGYIIDGLNVLSSGGELIGQIEPNSILDVGLQEKFASLTLVKGSTQHYYNTIPAAFAADRIVFTVGWDTENERVPSAGVIVYDLFSHRVISNFLSDFAVAPGYTGEFGVPSLHLSPDGNRVIIEQYDWCPESGNESRQVRVRTGQIAIYDADKGALLGTVTLESSHNHHADGHVINFSNDGRYLYYWFDSRVFVIDLENNRVGPSAMLPTGFDPAVVLSGR